jgi:hypothetical protein
MTLERDATRPTGLHWTTLERSKRRISICISDRWPPTVKPIVAKRQPQAICVSTFGGGEEATPVLTGVFVLAALGLASGEAVAWIERVAKRFRSAWRAAATREARPISIGLPRPSKAAPAA